MVSTAAVIEAPRLGFGEPTADRLERLLRLQNAHAKACALLRRRLAEGTTGDVFLLHAARCSMLGWLLVRGRREAGLPSRRIRRTAFTVLGHYHAKAPAALAWLSNARTQIGGAS